MSNLKQLLDAREVEAVWAQTQDVKEIARAARGSKSRVRGATGVLAVHQTEAGDKQITRWLGQKVHESALRGLLDVVREHEQVDRFCPQLAELLPTVRFGAWSSCVATLLWMRAPEALGHVLSYAEQSSHGSPGTLNLLARGGKIEHEGERVRRLVDRFAGTDKLDEPTRWWILAKLGDESMHAALVELCVHGAMDGDRAMRAAQALSNIHGWGAPWGEEGVELVRGKLRELGSS